ncbi:MAG: DUF4249 domain-containing protein [Bacteroidales bacterium]|nr:DUF4249 domain-containing protein [Bacteroidales bacterium]
MKRLFFFCIFFLPFLFWQCNNELDVNDEWKDYTIVYGLLNPNDNQQIIRISKSFLGYGNAYQMAQTTDSIYYQKPLNVKLEEWVNGNLQKTIYLTKDSIIPRDSGLFAFQKNYYYVTNEALNSTAIYKLIIDIDGKIVSSETNMINDFPFINIPSMFSFSTTSTFKFSFRTPAYARIFQAYLRFFYYEITHSDTVKKMIEIPFGKHIANTINGNEIVNYEYPGINFYSSIGTKIKDSDSVIKRVTAQNAVQLIIQAGSNELYAYMQVSAPSTNLSMDKPSYSNITNGIGLFTSRFTKYDQKKQLTQRTIDSIALGQFTKHLKFVNYSNSIILWQYLP